MDTDEDKRRLVLRAKDDAWVAYWARPYCLEDGEFLGSIRMSAVVDNIKTRDAFIQLMNTIVRECMHAQGNQTPSV